MPSWMTGVWAVGVWGAMAGSLLLLLRSRWAFLVFVVSFAAFLMSLVYTYLMTAGAQIMGPQAAVMNAVIAAGCIFFIWYARLMTKRGVLR